MITENSDIKTLFLPTDKGMLVLNTENIIRIQAISNYSKIYFSSPPGGGRKGVGTSLVVAKLLKWFEHKLPFNQFIRIHNTHIINHVYIQQYCKGSSGVLLNNNELIAVSRRKKKKLVSYFNELR